MHGSPSLSCRAVELSSCRAVEGVSRVSRADPRVAPLDEMAVFEVHLSRKVSLDKCSHQRSAHWQQYALHSAPSFQGVHLRGDVPCAVMRCLPPIALHTKGDRHTMFMEVTKKMPHHEATLLTHMTTS